MNDLFTYLDFEWISEGVVQMHSAQLNMDIEEIPAGTVVPLAEIDFNDNLVRLYNDLNDPSPRKFRLHTRVQCEV